MTLRSIAASDRISIMADWDSATYTTKHSPHPSVDTKPINGQFSEGFIEINGVESTKPVFICNATDVMSASQGDRLTIGSAEYIVEHAEPTGVGFMALFLDDL